MNEYILVVDDNPSGLYLKSRVLRRAGFAVSTAETATDALAHLERDTVQLAVLDVKLPDMHGFELSRLIKERFPGIVVLQTSATFTSTDDRVAGLDEGADAYLVEPMEEAELVATVRALLRLRKAESALRATEQRFIEFAQASPDVLWIYDPDESRFEYISPSFKELFGFKPENALSDPQLWLTSIRADHREAVLGMIQNAGTEKGEAVEYQILRPDGTERWVRDRVFLLPGELGRKPSVAGLVRDVTEAKRAERQRDLLIEELNHRVKNTLAIVQALAAHTRHTATSPSTFETAFTSRLHALAKAHDLLTTTRWEGTMLRNVIDAALSAFVGESDETERVTVAGPKVWLDANSAVTLTLTFHELATNAAKYGALSNVGGRVAVTWSAEPKGQPDRVRVQWIEQGGPAVTPPSHKGFGSLLIERILASEAHGEAQLEFAPSGLEFSVDLPLSDRVRLL